MPQPEPRGPAGATEADREKFDPGFAGHRSRQARTGLRLTPAERLKWLEHTMEEMRRLLGRAKQGRKIGTGQQ